VIKCPREINKITKNDRNTAPTKVEQYSSKRPWTGRNRPHPQAKKQPDRKAQALEENEA